MFRYLIFFTKCYVWLMFIDITHIQTKALWGPQNILRA